MHCPQSGPGSGKETVLTWLRFIGAALWIVFSIRLCSMIVLCMHDMWNGSFLGISISFGSQGKGQTTDVTLPLFSSQRGTPQTKLWFSPNSLSYDRDAQCEVHIQICNKPSARVGKVTAKHTNHHWPTNLGNNVFKKYKTDICARLHYTSYTL